MTAADIHRTILAVWRIEQPRLITGLSRMLRDVPLAEDLTQEALLAALEHWPVTGVPDKPGAWLMASAKRRALDHLRRRTMLARKHELLARELEQEQEAEAHGLLALMELNASRTSARTDAAGDPILLMDQNRALWDQLQIRRGLLALERVRRLGGGGFYALQAAIVACHATASTPDETDWPRIVALYTELAGLVRSPIIELNRAVAVGMTEGPAVALAMVEKLAHEPALKA